MKHQTISREKHNAIINHARVMAAQRMVVQTGLLYYDEEYSASGIECRIYKNNGGQLWAVLRHIPSLDLYFMVDADEA